MQVKTFAATLGAGMLAGAAVMLLTPKQSQFYRAADETARNIKRGVCSAVDGMMD